MNKTGRFALPLGCSLAATAACNLLFGSKPGFEITRYRIRKGLTRPLRIVMLSDLHDRQFGKNNCLLLQAVKDCRPDLILLTGDTVSQGAQKLARTCAFLKELSAVAPVCSNLGNHEQRFGMGETVAAAFADSGVRVLRNELALLDINGQPVTILGLCEQQALTRRDYLADMLGKLRHENHDGLLRALSQSEGVRILLSHFPENFSRIGNESYCRHPFEVMLSGHAHGGQWRLPAVGGLYAPGQGLLPLYDKGLYRRKSNALLVSAGLGNDSVLPRINNAPEVVLLTVE